MWHINPKLTRTDKISLPAQDFEVSLFSHTFSDINLAHSVKIWMSSVGNVLSSIDFCDVTSRWFIGKVLNIWKFVECLVLKQINNDKQVTNAESRVITISTKMLCKIFLVLNFYTSVKKSTAIYKMLGMLKSWTYVRSPLETMSIPNKKIYFGVLYYFVAKRYDAIFELRFLGVLGSLDNKNGIFEILKSFRARK